MSQHGVGCWCGTPPGGDALDWKAGLPEQGRKMEYTNTLFHTDLKLFLFVLLFFFCFMAAHDFHVNSMVSHDTAAWLLACLKCLEHLLTHCLSLCCHTVHSDRNTDVKVIQSCTSRPSGKSVCMVIWLTSVNFIIYIYRHIPKSAFFFPLTLILSNASINPSLKVGLFEQLCVHFAQNGKKILCCAMQTIRFNGLLIAAVLLSP